jgi:GAF domain-containing protein
VLEIQEIVRSAARRLTGADGAAFVLRDGPHCHYVDEDVSPLWKGQRFPIETCIGGWAMLNRRPAVVPDIYADERIPHDAYRPTFVKSLAMVPIRTLEPVGAIGNYWASKHKPSEQQVELLQALADSTAVALDNVRVYEELEEARLETLERLALTAEHRDDATYEHTRRVARTSRLLAP